MPSSLTIRHARLVLPDRVATGDLVIEDGVIAHIGPNAPGSAGEEIDGRGLTALPGVIDTQVHFREPGYTHKEDIASGSRAAAAGGVTSVLEMPNSFPPVTTVEELARKLATFAGSSVVHYGCFIGATPDNLEELESAERAAGVVAHLGASDGPLAIPGPDVLEHIFANVDRLIAVHPEDAARLRERRLVYEGTHDPAVHPRVRDVESSLGALRTALDLGHKHGSRLHLLHVSSAEEADLLAGVPRDRVTCSIAAPHLFLEADTAYQRLGTRAQLNPPIRGRRHAEVLWKRLREGTIDCVASDHSPHTIEEKARPYPEAPSGAPGVEWLLPLMLDQVAQGRIGLRDVATWLCEAPAACFRIPRKGRLEVGYDGDVVLVDLAATRTVEDGESWTRAGWSPYAGWSLTGWPVLTAVLGRPVFRDGAIQEGAHGRELTFAR